MAGSQRIDPTHCLLETGKSYTDNRIEDGQKSPWRGGSAGTRDFANAFFPAADRRERQPLAHGR